MAGKELSESATDLAEKCFKLWGRYCNKNERFTLSKDQQDLREKLKIVSLLEPGKISKAFRVYPGLLTAIKTTNEDIWYEGLIETTGKFTWKTYWGILHHKSSSLELYKIKSKKLENCKSISPISSSDIYASEKDSLKLSVKLDNEVYKFRAICIEEREEWVQKLQNVSGKNLDTTPEVNIPSISENKVHNTKDVKSNTLDEINVDPSCSNDPNISAIEQEPMSRSDDFERKEYGSLDLKLPLSTEKNDTSGSENKDYIPSLVDYGTQDGFSPRKVTNGTRDDISIDLSYSDDYTTTNIDTVDLNSQIPLITNSLEVKDLLGNVCLVYVGFLTIGMGSLLPWNFFITAEYYWQWKLRNINATDISWKNGTLTQLQELWSPLQVITSNFSYVIFLVINAFFFSKFKQSFRVLGPMACMIFFFVINAVLANVDTDSWQIIFLVFTLGIIFLMNMCGAVLVSNLYGIAGMFPTAFVMTALLSGEALGGVFAAVARIASLAIDCDCVIHDTTIYFLSAIGVLLLSIMVYMKISKIDFYQEYASFQPLYEDTLKEQLEECLIVLKKIWRFSLSIFFVFFITISVYPAICIRIKSTNVSHPTWSKSYFRPVITFFVFSICDLIGRQFAGFFSFPGKYPNIVLSCTVLRTLYIPLFLMCNNGYRLIPYVLGGDKVYIPLMVTFALSNGYLMALCMIKAPENIIGARYKRIAGFIMATTKGLGLFLGGVFSLVLEQIN